MAKPAPSFFYALPKFVPLGKTLESLPEFLKRRCNPMFLQGYTLCEVRETERQSVPPRVQEPEQAAQFQLQVAKSHKLDPLTHGPSIQ